MVNLVVIYPFELFSLFELYEPTIIINGIMGYRKVYEDLLPLNEDVTN